MVSGQVAPGGRADSPLAADLLHLADGLAAARRQPYTTPSFLPNVAGAPRNSPRRISPSAERGITMRYPETIPGATGQEFLVRDEDAPVLHDTV